MVCSGDAGAQLFNPLHRRADLFIAMTRSLYQLLRGPLGVRSLSTTQFDALALGAAKSLPPPSQPLTTRSTAGEWYTLGSGTDVLQWMLDGDSTAPRLRALRAAIWALAQTLNRSSIANDCFLRHAEMRGVGTALRSAVGTQGLT